MDEDWMPGGDDEIGYAYLWTSEAAVAINSIEKIRPKWHSLHLPKSSKAQGQALLSFYFIEESRQAEFDLENIDVCPDLKLYTFEIFLLGMRSLKPKGLFPIKKSFINFDLNCLNQCGKTNSGSFLKNIKTNPCDKGPNPNMNAIIKFDVELPIDEIFMPNLQCGVFDLILAGLSDSSLGLFIIPIKERIDYSLNWKKQFDDTLHALVENHVNEVDANLKTENKEEKLEVAEENKEGNEQKVKENPLEKANPEEEILAQTLGNPDEKKEKKGMDELEEVQNEILPKRTLSTTLKDVIILPFYTFIETPKKGGDEGETKKVKIEDESKRPDADLYMEIGWNRRDGPEMKHYRRYFRTPLEAVEELNVKSPFDVYYVNRGEFKDVSKESAIFDAMRDVSTKILKRYSENPSQEIERVATKHSKNVSIGSKAKVVI